MCTVFGTQAKVKREDLSTIKNISNWLSTVRTMDHADEDCVVTFI